MKFPILRIDIEKAKANIERMLNKSKNLNLELRPHFKTHQSHEIGQWFKNNNITAITVSSIAMAEYFAKDGWKDITIAFPFSILDANRVIQLANQISLKILVDDLDIIHYLKKNIESKISIYIEIDPNYGRSGVKISDYNSIELIIHSINDSTNLQFEGFYTHVGQTYQCKNQNEIIDLSTPIIHQFSTLKVKFGGNLCWGDTPSCSILEDFGNINQISPGNFIFYDWMQTIIGSSSPDNIAVAVECPVVAKYPHRHQLLIHGGAVHFSKEFAFNKFGKKNYGQVFNPTNNSDTSNFIASLSQEHGVISCSEDFFKSVQIGDIIKIYPIHSCLTANLMQCYITNTNDCISHFGSGTPFRIN